MLIKDGFVFRTHLQYMSQAINLWSLLSETKDLAVQPVSVHGSNNRAPKLLYFRISCISTIGFCSGKIRIVFLLQTHQFKKQTFDSLVKLLYDVFKFMKISGNEVAIFCKGGVRHSAPPRIGQFWQLRIWFIYSQTAFRFHHDIFETIRCLGSEPIILRFEVVESGAFFRASFCSLW